MPSPLALSLTPPLQHYHGKPVKVTITNISSHPLTVTSTTLALGQHCAEREVTGVRVHPASFLLHVGQARRTVTVVLPAHGVADTDVGVLFGSTVRGASGQVASAGVGSQILTGGAVSCIKPTPVAVRPVAASSFPVLPLALALVAVLGIIAGLAFTLRRRRRRPFERHHTY